MSVLSAAEIRPLEMHGAVFTPLASPKRGTLENSVWQVEIAPGTPATPHQVTREEILVVLAGHAIVTLADEESTAGPGDVIVVPRDTPFALRVAGETAFRAMVCFPVGGQAILGDGTKLTPPWAQ